jgi:hypothetical protein
LILLLSPGLLLGCSLECDFCKNELEAVATLPHTGGGIHPLPHDVWTPNPELEAFLRDALKAAGVRSLAAKYALQCLPPPLEAGCSDCATCRKTVKEWRMGSIPPPVPLYMPIWKCVDYGEVLVQADIGPGSSIKAMTYWQTSSEARQQLAKIRQGPIGKDRQSRSQAALHSLTLASEST